jgi:predicted nuclease with TOPRIM domain
MTTQPTTIDQLCLQLLKEQQAFEQDRTECEEEIQQLWLDDYQLEVEMLQEENDELDSENDDLRFQLADIQQEILQLSELSLQLPIDI